MASLKRPLDLLCLLKLLHPACQPRKIREPNIYSREQQPALPELRSKWTTQQTPYSIIACSKNKQTIEHPRRMTETLGAEAFTRVPSRNTTLNLPWPSRVRVERVSVSQERDPLNSLTKPPRGKTPARPVLT